MCGIVAIISKSKAGFFQADKTIFLQMLISNMFRGMDSTGVFGVNKHGNLEGIKDASPASFFINKKETDTFFSKFIMDHHIVVGHNRKATMGGINPTNAHPFVEGNICLVHNGTLTNHKKLANTVIDSHAICTHIAEKGYKSLLKNIEGAYALIWYNAENKTLYFTRNAERPLFLVETQDKIYLASEGKMLDWILDRNNISKYEVQNVPTDKVFKFDLETRKLESEYKPKKETVSNVQTMMAPWTPPQKTRHQQSQLTLGLQKCFQESSEDQAPTASIETYKSGEKISIKVIDFEINSHSWKLICETLDNTKTTAFMYLSNDKYSAQEIDNYINATELVGTVATITQKAGIVTLYLKDISHEVKWVTRDGSYVDPKELEEAGGACYQCGKTLDTKESVEFAEVTQNKHKNITYILCESCADAYNNTAFRYM